MKAKPNGKNCLERISYYIIFKLESIFYFYGKLVSKRPCFFIVICLLICSLSALGLVRFTKEDRPFKLWIPLDSEFLKVLEWQNENFPNIYRNQLVIYESENVLHKESLLKMLHIHNVVKSIKESSVRNTTFDSICAKIPKMPDSYLKRKRRSFRRVLPYSRFKRQIGLFKCLTINSLENRCMEASLLDIWNYDGSLIESLSQDQLLLDVNEAYDRQDHENFYHVANLLGEIEWSSKGLIVGAKAARHFWITKASEDVSKEDSVHDSGRMTLIDKATFEWEKKFIAVMQNESQSSSDVQIYFNSAASFGIITNETLIGDVFYFIYGFVAVFIFVQITLGRFNMVEQRSLLSLFGLICIPLSLLVSAGVCSAFSIPYGPVNNVLPMLLLGLGVDDMFVIMQSWDNLSPVDTEKDISTRIGLTLKHAGVSITITSLTDFAVFVIGGTTVLPGLKSFCLYAAVGVVALYFLQITFFVSWFTLDQQRLENNYHGLFWCYKVKDWHPNECCYKNISQVFFEKIFSNFILKVITKVVVIIFTLLSFGISCWGTYNLRQDFDFIMLFPKDSHIYKFYMKLKDYFTYDGADGMIYFGNMTLYEELTKFDIFIQRLKASPFIGKVDSWYEAYKNYWSGHGYKVPDPDLDQETFLHELEDFLFSPSGFKYKIRNFKFDGKLDCSEPLPSILASSFDYKHTILNGSKMNIAALEEIRELTKEMNFSGYAQPMSIAYSAWESDKIIMWELFRNLVIATAVIFIMTLLLIASLRTSFLVILCVVMTITDVMALMHWWGLTVDTVSSIALILAVGLCIDYSAHIGHAFMTADGTRNNRAHLALKRIGPAVLKGGFCMFLSFIFIAGSDNHVSMTFFKIFLGVCWIGLYHGLFFLPVILSLFGPPPYTAFEQPTDTAESLHEVQVKLHDDSINSITPSVANS